MKSYFFRFFLTTGCLLLIITIFSQVLSIVGNDFDKNYLKVPSQLKEKYDPEIASIISMQELKEILNQSINEKGLLGIEVPIFIDDVVRDKFFHSVAFIENKGNWVLSLIDFFFPKYLFTTAMDPQEIIKKNHGICNQQAILFQELVDHFGFEFASVGINFNDINTFSHFASAVKVNENWYYFDSNMEPEYDRKDHEILQRILSADKEIYKEFYPKYNFEMINQNMIEFRDLNTFPASTGVLVQKISQFLSNYLWLFFLLLALFFKNKKKNEIF